MGYGMDVEDFGGFLAEQDFLDEYIGEIYEDRMRRLNDLKGKYVITCKGNKSHKKCYLQDRNINKGGWWTQYLSNALGYNSKKSAEEKCKQFKYNKCKVELVVI